MEATRQLKVNLKFKDQPCSICSRPFELGEALSICNACEAASHTPCWDQQGGCSTQGCANAPLQQLAPEQAAPQMPPGFRGCPACGMRIHQEDDICMHCNAITTPDGVYRGPQENAPGTTAALVFGILAFFICGIIFGIVAIVKARESTPYRGDPRYKGFGMATAGMVLGIIALIINVIVIITQIGGASSGGY